MSGIAAYGVHLPIHRLPLAVLAGKNKEGGPERTVAWADEDSVTMAVEAARKALVGRDRDGIGLLVFATTTHAFAEKQGAALIAAALGLPAQVRTADVGHSLRGGAQALGAAFDAVDAGHVREALVIVSDCRMGAPGSDLERSGGDGAAAFLVTAEAPLATFIGSAQESQELVDIWRRAGDRFTHGWEERFTTSYGYLEPAVAAARSLTDRFADLDPAGWTWAASAPNARALGTFAGKMKLGEGRVRPGLYDRIGFAGAAQAPLLLAGALDEAQPGDRIAMLVHGDGAEALLFEVKSAAPAAALQPALDRRMPVRTLASYRRARDLDLSEYPAVDDQGISATIHFRERAENLRLQGQRCACGEPQFPKGRVCIRCGAKDDFTDEDFAERSGQIVTYTLDAFFPAPDPPTPVAVVQVDNGPRIYMQLADIAASEVDIDLKVRFAFRRIHQAGRRPNYFWKAVPERSLS
ncbi:OB-fold domain-containing protein [Sphingobium estronivorans]|uniref:OB-fold domain-containing protein n=1 Tax=Sphingobium estronivorans TaxID=1577690 RepID=UPI00123BB8E5|nr:OB-fold domain-containing protein [Sphingobium estronivorans]